jgi:chaperonin GroEL
VTLDDCGRADKVWSDKDNTKIIGGKGNKSALEARIKQLRAELDVTTSDFDKEKIQERLAKLAGGVAVINVGAATEVEMKEKKERVLDAVAATKAGIEEGIVPGGGVTFIKARKVLLALQESLKVDDEKHGVRILYDALSMPTRMIARNAGTDDGYVLRLVEDNKGVDFGFNALSNEFGSMLAAGVVDPAKVVRSAIQNAASVAVMVLTTECLVTDIPEKKPEMPAMPGGMGGMGGGMDY